MTINYLETGRPVYVESQDEIMLLTYNCETITVCNYFVSCITTVTCNQFKVPFLSEIAYVSADAGRQFITFFGLSGVYVSISVVFCLLLCDVIMRTVDRALKIFESVEKRVKGKK